MVSVNTGYQFDPNDEEQKKGNFQVLGGMIGGTGPQTVQTEGAQAPAQAAGTPNQSYKIEGGSSVAQKQFEANKNVDPGALVGEKVGKLKEGISTAQKKSNDAYAAFSANNKFDTTVDPNEIEGLAKNDQGALKEFQGLKTANQNKFEDGVDLSGYDSEINNLSSDVYGFTNPNASRGQRALDAALLRNSGKVGTIRSDLESGLTSAKQGVQGNRTNSDSLVKDFETQRQQELARVTQAIQDRMGSIDTEASMAGKKQGAVDQAAREQFQQNEALRLRQALEQRLGNLGSDYSSLLSDYYANNAGDNVQTKSATGNALFDQQAQIEGKLKAMLEGGAAPAFTFEGGSDGGGMYNTDQATAYNNLAAILGTGGVRTPGSQNPLITKSNVDEILANAPKLALNRVQKGSENDWVANAMNSRSDSGLDTNPVFKRLGDASTGRGYAKIIDDIDGGVASIDRANQAVDKIAPTTYQREAVIPKKESAWTTLKKALGGK